VLCGRGLSDEPIPRPEESHRLNISLCVIQKPQELGGPGPRWAVASEEKRIMPKSFTPLPPLCPMSLVQPFFDVAYLLLPNTLHWKKSQNNPRRINKCLQNEANLRPPRISESQKRKNIPPKRRNTSNFPVAYRTRPTRILSINTVRNLDGFYLKPGLAYMKHEIGTQSANFYSFAVHIWTPLAQPDRLQHLKHHKWPYSKPTHKHTHI
jgi:hypothetical protein